MRLSSASVCLSVFVAMMSGCVSGPAGQPLAVPAGAELLAYGSPPPPFAIPREAGKLYVFNDDYKRVVLVTTYGTSAAAGTIDLDETPGFRELYQAQAHLRVYFVPDRLATTQP